MPYKLLDADKVTETVVKLSHRIEERFPTAGLARMCHELTELARKAQRESLTLARPIYALRAISVLLAALILVGLGVMLYSLGTPAQKLGFAEFVQVLEAGINDVVLIGLGIYFLISLERRIKRRRVLRLIHELRSIAHVVDMHQLTKDPSRILHQDGDTASSPARALSPADLARYLDYCSEMLSLTGKLAALYVQRMDDDVVLGAVNEVETLTTGLSRKIWQKLMVLESTAMEDPTNQPALDSDSDIQPPLDAEVGVSAASEG